jgi:HEPN domain-containing protein/predicted nucleotidyltransferase
MKSSLSYLPQIKQDQILQVVDIIKEIANPEKIILFGSYATNKYVEHTYLEDGTRYDYISDFDFLIVSKKDDEREFIVKDKIANKTRTLFKTAVNPIIHSIEYVNEGLEIGQYFFTDIVKEGILLYDTKAEEFATARVLTYEEKILIATRYFKQWFNAGSALLNSSKFNLGEKELKLSAFELHQASESFYNTVLLVYTSYKPKTHNLDILRQYAKPLSKRLFSIFPFPNDNEYECHLFDLLKRGYIDARYKNDYQISIDELVTLIDKVTKMKAIVKGICDERIAAIK